MYASQNIAQTGLLGKVTSDKPAIYAPTPALPYLVLDIETGNAPGEAIDNALNTWKAPSNIKDPEKIEARRKEAFDKIIERAALLDASPILCVVIKCAGCRMIFDGMGATTAINGWIALHTMSEAAMLANLRGWLDLNTNQDTKLVGHNCRAFDLPKLRHAYLRNRLRLPEILKPRGLEEERAEVIDTVAVFRHFSMEHRDDFCTSLDTVCASLGIDRPKAIISGADVPRLHSEGRYAEILTYCAIDTAATEGAYLLMSGQAQELL